MQISNSSIGIFWMLVHCFMITSLSIVVKYLMSDYSIYQIIFLYSILSFLIVLLYYFYLSKTIIIRTNNIKLHIARGFLGFFSLVIYYSSFNFISLSDARGIALAGPLVSSVFAILFLKEKIGIYRSTGLIIGFFGALIILRPGSIEFSYASLLVVLALFIRSITDILIKKISRTENTLVQFIYFSFFMTIFSLPFAILNWEMPLNLLHMLLFFLCGSIFVLNCLAIYFAIKYSDITLIMPFDFSGMVFTVIIAYVVFKEIPDNFTILGSIIIFLSIVFIAKREAYLKKCK